MNRVLDSYGYYSLRYKAMQTKMIRPNQALK